MSEITYGRAVEGLPHVWDSQSVIARHGSRRALAVVGVLIALLFAVPRVLTHTPYARLGVTLEWTPEGYARVERVVGPPAEGLLRRGDLLISADGQPLTRPSDSDRWARTELPREAILFDVLRGSERFEMLVPPARLTVWNRIRYLLVPLAAVVATPLVAFALVWRRPDLGTAWVFFAFATLRAVSVVHEIYQYPESEATGAFRAFLGLYGWIVCWLPATFLHFVAVFPRPRWRPETRFRSVWFWLVAAAYVVPFFLVAGLARAEGLDKQAFRVFESVGLALGVVSLVDRYARPASADWNPPRSHRILGLLVAALFLLSTILGWLIEDPRAQALLQSPLVRVLVPMVGVAVLFTPFIIAYLIARDPAFDPRRIIERSLPYVLLSGILATLYLGIVLVGQRAFAAATGEQALTLNVVAALVLAFVFAPARERLQSWLDRLFRRDLRALRSALDQAGRELLSASDRDEVRASVEHGITRGVGREVSIDWPEAGPPHVARGEELSDDARGAVESLLLQSSIRLENLALLEQRAQAERRAAELRESATRAELRALHAQVQPHFLFNALNALSYLTETDPAAAQRFTERLADMLRYTIEAGNQPSALLSDEIGFVEDYLGVARERYEGALSFRYEGSPELLSAAVPPLLLQPLIENSLKHGMGNGRTALSLALEARREGGWLTLKFSDDGTAGGNGARGFGVGLENLDQRVRRFGGPEASMMAGPGRDGGFTVTVRWREAAAMGER